MDIDPIIETVRGRRTHRYWWTWIPAHPLSQDDHWYRVLWRVVADHTTNCRTRTGWAGSYTEGAEDHQTVSVFHTFSALPTAHWIESLLEACSVDVKPPVLGVRWQYQLDGDCVGGGSGMADIALRILDSAGVDDEIVVVFEAKKKGGPLKPKDEEDPDSYLRLEHFADFKRKYVVFLIDESDVAKHESLVGRRVVTWQKVASIQLGELDRLVLPDATEKRLLALVQRHLEWFDLVEASGEDGAVIEPDQDIQLTGLNPRIEALIRGAEVVLRARDGLHVRPTAAWLGDELSIADYSELKEMGPAHWGRPVW